MFFRRDTRERVSETSSAETRALHARHTRRPSGAETHRLKLRTVRTAFSLESQAPPLNAALRGRATRAVLESVFQRRHSFFPRRKESRGSLFLHTRFKHVRRDRDRASTSRCSRIFVRNDSIARNRCAVSSSADIARPQAGYLDRQALGRCAYILDDRAGAALPPLAVTNSPSRSDF